MKKKEYIVKLKNLILQRVKYHAPNFYSGDIDYSLLDAIGIDASYPVFLFKKPMNKVFLKAFEEAKKDAKFNLVLLEKPLFKIKKLEMLDNAYLILKDEIGCNLYNTLEALNINYLTHSDFKNELDEESIKINGQKVSFNYLPFFYTQKSMHDGVIVEIKQFLLNGKNNIINLLNTQKATNKIKLEINIPLPRGYYFFNKSSNCIEIKNLVNREKAYFNFNFKGAKFCFSNLSGIESCTFACVHVCCDITLLPQQKMILYFNFGENKYCINNPKLLEYYFKLSQNKMNEIFDIKVQSHDSNFDNTFNVYLPRKIWEKWQKFDVDEESINEWLKLKAKIVKNTAKGEQISQEIRGIKEVKFYRNSGWKRVFVLHNNSNYIYANNVKYFNYNLLTNEIFKKNNEIYLSFAE